MDKLTDDLLTIILMHHDWISRRQILAALDMPLLPFPRNVRDRLCALELCGLIESRRVEAQVVVVSYRATDKAREG